MNGRFRNEKARLATILWCTLLTVLGQAQLPAASFAQKIVEIKMTSTPDGSKMFFDPIGVHIDPGDTIRWVQIRDYHSVAAYHPDNDNHPLRIPENAKPWDSGVLLGEYPESHSTFEHTFVIEGVYDYYCSPHERAGMVGRIIVGKPVIGPGTKPFDDVPEKKWKSVPSAAQKQFPAIEDIISKGMVRLPEASE